MGLRMPCRARPIRRRLMCLAISCLCGVYGASITNGFVGPCGVLCALLAGIGVCRALRRKGALLFAALAMACLGYVLAGAQLALRDTPTDPGVYLSGTVSRIMSDNRVILSNVAVGGELRLSRPAAVTLMAQEQELRTAPRIGERVEGTGRLFAPDEPRNPGETDRRITALRDGYELSGYLIPGWEASGRARFSLAEVFYRARRALLERTALVFGEDAPLYQGVLLGESAGLDDEVALSMRLTGTAHILTVSGLHLNLIAAALDALLGKLTRRRGMKLTIRTLLLTAFAALTGFAAGTVRALIMVTLRALARVRGREYDPLTGLSAAAIAMTLIRPVWPLDGSFQFSFYVVLGILLLNERLTALLLRCCPEGGRERLRRPIALLAVSASAQLAAVPMQLWFYGYMPLLALPMNLLLSAIVPVLIAAGAACLAVSALSLQWGAACAAVLGAPGRAFMRLSVAAAGVSGGIVRLPAPYAVTVALCALLMALCSSQIRRPKGGGLRIAAVLALVALTLPRFCPAARYVQLDVGQGDAAILRSGRSAVLVDIGSQSSYAALRYLRHEGLRVETVFLSHLDEDHAGALATLLASEVEIGSLAMPERAEEDTSSQAVLEALTLARARGIPICELSRGDSVSAMGLRFDVLSPARELKGSNERSLLLQVELEGVSLLLTGDLPAASEPETLPDCDVLKVAHHGSRYATSQRLLEQTTPRVALISVGARNSYGHPTERVLGDLAAIGAEIYRTDESGCVTLWLREGNWRAQTFLPSGG